MKHAIREPFILAEFFYTKDEKLHWEGAYKGAAHLVGASWNMAGECV